MNTVSLDQSSPMDATGVIPPVPAAFVLLSRVLAWQGGGAVSARALSEAAVGNTSPAELVARVQATGRTGRVVVATPSVLRRLPLPTLVGTADGALRLLLGIEGRRATIETEDGATLDVPLASLGDAARGPWALDFTAELGGSGGFVSRVIAAVGAQRGRLIFLAALSIPAQGLELLAPLVVQTTTDEALPNVAHHMLAVLALAVIALAAHRAGLAWVRARVHRHLDAALESSLLRAAFAHVVRAPYRDFSQLSVGELTQSLGAAVSAGNLGASLARLPVEELLQACFCGALLLVVAPHLALLLTLLAALAVAGAGVLSLRHARLQREELDASAREQSYLCELVTGAPTVRAMGAASSVVTRWLGRLVDEQMASLRRLRTALWLDVLFDGSQQLANLLLLIYGARQCLAGELSVGALLALVMWADGYLGAALRLGHVAFQISGSTPSFKRAERLFAMPSTPAATAKLSQSTTTARLVFRDVWFRYGPQHPWILEGYDLEVEPGRNLVLKGRSGMGKTTILRLASGMLTPDRGSVTVNGAPALDARSLVTYLPQDARLFEGSLLTNLELLSGATPERLKEAALRTGLATWVETLPMGYETVISAGGHNVSGGQRQLVLLTALVASERPLLLLDEPTAHLDRASRARLEAANLFADRTVVTVVHDDAVLPRETTPVRGR